LHEKFPNTVELSSDNRLRGAMEQLQPGFPRLVALNGPRRLQQH